MAFTEYTLLSILLLLLSVGFITAQSICVKITKMETTNISGCKDDENYNKYSTKKCILYSQIYISNKHSNISIKDRYKETLHMNTEKELSMKKFWTFDQKLPDVVQFNLTIYYAKGERPQIPVDYYLIPFQTNMDKFPHGQQFNIRGNIQNQQSRIEIHVLNNCTFQNGKLYNERNKEPPRNNVIVKVNGIAFNRTDLYFYKIYSQVNEGFDFTMEPNLNETLKRKKWYLTTSKYWELWLVCLLAILTVILSITSAFYWCWIAEQKT